MIVVGAKGTLYQGRGRGRMGGYKLLGGATEPEVQFTESPGHMADQAHAAAQHVKQLRQLVQVGRPQESPQRRDARVAVRRPARTAFVLAVIAVIAVLFGEPDTPRFLAAVQRLKRQLRLRARLTRRAKQQARANLRRGGDFPRAARPSVLGF